MPIVQMLHLFSFEFSRALENWMVTDETKIWQALVADRKLTSFLPRRYVCFECGVTDACRAIASSARWQRDNDFLGSILHNFKTRRGESCEMSSPQKAA